MLSVPFESSSQRRFDPLPSAPQVPDAITVTSDSVCSFSISSGIDSACVCAVSSGMASACAAGWAAATAQTTASRTSSFAYHFFSICSSALSSVLQIFNMIAYVSCNFKSAAHFSGAQATVFRRDSLAALLSSCQKPLPGAAAVSGSCAILISAEVRWGGRSGRR